MDKTYSISITPSNSSPLPPLIAGKSYSFTCANPVHIPDSNTYTLMIPEQPGRGAEAQPLYAEQDQWVNSVLKKSIALDAIWYSHWELNSNDDLPELLDILRSFGAVIREETVQA